MTARQPRRTRRRALPGTTLPRPVPGAAFGEDDNGESEGSVASARTTRRPTRHREHHVTTDYSYVNRDLLTVLVVGLVALGFILGMSFVV